jgi:hypothetical protein
MSPLAVMPQQLWNAFEEASWYDKTIRVEPRVLSKLFRRYVPPAAYNHSTLFDRMLAGEPSVLTGFPKPLRQRFRDLPPVEAGLRIADWLAAHRSRKTHRIFTGPTGVRRELRLRDIALKWRANQTRCGVTDLHIRNTSMEDVIAPDVLSRFNLLCCSSSSLSEQEMFSFVISTSGHVTDSHSDDPDSTNFCFTGKKLWLAWDTYEGMKHGLEDVERVVVRGQARFDMETWLSLRSARWFFVNPGQTLFLPAHLTHKVVTLEPYIGVGGFFIALPNCLRLMSHWILRGPLWSKRDETGLRDELLGEIALTVREAMLRLRGASYRKQRQWGYDFLEKSARHFVDTCSVTRLRTLWRDERFRCIAEEIRAPWPVASRAARLSPETAQHWCCGSVRTETSRRRIRRACSFSVARFRSP